MSEPQPKKLQAGMYIHSFDSESVNSKLKDIRSWSLMPAIFLYLQSFVSISLSGARLSKDIKKARKDLANYWCHWTLPEINSTASESKLHQPSSWRMEHMFRILIPGESIVENWCVRQTWIQILPLKCSSCVTLGKLLNLSVFPCPYLSNEEDNNIYFVE